MTEFNEMQTVKRRFFAMRNGVIADTMRRAASPYKIVFGLNLPQIKDIAVSIGENAGLAERLWADNRTRESMLLAPYLMPREAMDEPTARRWLAEAVSAEAVDVLCLARLRDVDFARSLFGWLAGSGTPLGNYAALRLFLNNRNAGIGLEALALARCLADEGGGCRSIAAQVIWECEE